MNTALAGGKGLMPVFLGADLNCYSMARAFHEAYGVKAHAFGRWAMGETKYSRIVKFTAVDGIDTGPVLLKTLEDFALLHPGKTKILLGCTDDYASLLIRHKKQLSKHYIVPYIDESLMNLLVSKESFYAACHQHGILYPKTHILRRNYSSAELEALPFSYPVVIKPSSSIQYWKHPFSGMKKVYFAANPGQAGEIAGQIFASGYPDSIIVQDMVPGADSAMYVLTAYCDEEAKVRMMCLGHVLLEEHTPRAIGNHAAIVTECHRPLMEKLAAFLESVGYTGFANFDIKYDERDGSYRVFEINLRQGRSNYYVTGAGQNLARWLVEDRVLHQPAAKPVYHQGESFWHSIPLQVVRRYTADARLAEQALAIAEKGQDTSSLYYKPDLRLNPVRRLYLWEHDRRYVKKYATYCEKVRD